jgi:hypothetical protein
MLWVYFEEVLLSNLTRYPGRSFVVFLSSSRKMSGRYPSQVAVLSFPIVSSSSLISHSPFNAIQPATMEAS